MKEKNFIILFFVCCLLVITSLFVFFDGKESTNTKGIIKQKPALSDVYSAIPDSDEPTDIKSVGNNLTENNSITESASEDLQDLVESLSNLTANEIVIKLLIEERYYAHTTKILLELIKNGTLGINESLKGNDNKTAYYTPLYVALIPYDQVSYEEFSEFMDLGAAIDTSNAWLSKLAKIKDERIIQRWVDESGVGPEHYDQLMNLALSKGSPELASYIREYDLGGINYTFDPTLFTKSKMNIKDYIASEIDKEKYAQSGRITPFQFITADISRANIYLNKVRVMKMKPGLTQSEIDNFDKSLIVIQERIEDLQKIKQNL